MKNRGWPDGYYPEGDWGGVGWMTILLLLLTAALALLGLRPGKG